MPCSAGVVVLTHSSWQTDCTLDGVLAEGVQLPWPRQKLRGDLMEEKTSDKEAESTRGECVMISTWSLQGMIVKGFDSSFR